MAETYSSLLPGNIINKSVGYPLPNASFTTNKRVSGDPRDRQQGAWLTIPGWQFVRKIGYVHINDQPGAVDFDVIVPSPNTEPARDKHIADVRGLFVPSGAMFYRLGLRVEKKSRQPGTYSSGPRGAVPPGPEDAGLVGTATDLLVLGDAIPAAGAAGNVKATSAHTDSSAGTCGLKFDASGRITVPATGLSEVVTNNPWDGTAQPTTTDLTLKLFSVDTTGAAAGSAVTSDFLGGVYIVCEVAYMVKEEAVGLDEVHLPGALYSGQIG